MLRRLLLVALLTLGAAHVLGVNEAVASEAPSIGSLSLETTSLIFVRDGGDHKVYKDSTGTAVAIYRYDKPPDLQASPSDVEGLRSAFRTAAAAGGAGIVEVESVTVAGMAAARVVVKIPQAPRGMAYAGSIILPFRDRSYVIRVEAKEQGTTGARDAAVLDRMLASGRVTVGSKGIEGWFRDPYDPAIVTPVRWNLSEDAAYDAQFPAHPLTLVRALLSEISAGARLAPDELLLPPFEAPPR